MNKSCMKKTLLALAIVLVLVSCAFAAETSWRPAATVSIIVPAGEGENVDLSARVFAHYAKELSGCDFMVVNVNGASGSLAADKVRASSPDGHTFLYGHNLVNLANVARLTDYNYTAFTLGPTFAKDPACQFYVNSKKYQNLDDFIKAAKERPGELLACTEMGAYTYYELLKFQELAGIQLDLVDYGSNSDKIVGILSGELDVMPASYINCKDFLESGQFTALGTPSAQRYAVIKDIPTFREQGIDFVYPDCDYSLYFPKGTPEAVIMWYENIVKEMHSSPQCLEAIRELAIMPYYLSAADSEKHDAEYFTVFKTIAEQLAE